MTFPITILAGRKRYHLQVEPQPAAKEASLEVFKVYPRDNPAKYILLQSNRPVLRRHQLKHKPIDWKVIQGNIYNRYTFRQVIEAIEHNLNKL